MANLDLLPPEHAWLAAANEGLWTTLDGSRWSTLGPTGLPGSRVVKGPSSGTASAP